MNSHVVYCGNNLIFLTKNIVENHFSLSRKYEWKVYNLSHEIQPLMSIGKVLPGCLDQGMFFCTVAH